MGGMAAPDETVLPVGVTLARRWRKGLERARGALAERLAQRVRAGALVPHLRMSGGLVAALLVLLSTLLGIVYFMPPVRTQPLVLDENGRVRLSGSQGDAALDPDDPPAINYTQVRLEQERVFQNSMKLLEEERRLEDSVKALRGSTFIIQPPPLTYGLGNQLQVLNNAFRLAMLLGGRLVKPVLAETWHNEPWMKNLTSKQLRRKTHTMSVFDAIQPTELSEKVIMDDRVICSKHSVLLAANKRWSLNKTSVDFLHDTFASYVLNRRLDFNSMRIVAFGELMSDCKGQIPCVAAQLTPRPGSYEHMCLFVVESNVNSLKVNNETLATLFDALVVRDTFKSKFMNLSHVEMDSVVAFHMRWNERHCPLEVDMEHPIVCLFGSHKQRDGLNTLLPVDKFLEILEATVQSMDGITSAMFLFSPFAPENVTKQLQAAPFVTPYPFGMMHGLDRNLVDFLVAVDAGHFLADPYSSWSDVVAETRRRRGLPVHVMSPEDWT
ncbi:hypothetical protein FVE85_4298 [Porphyridium purpureum]|uniref:O-fucosyltransferase family protein n=1 Tax=Porphyridium purpureum TaxID=35688 RepID=A0A5J4YU87_PORPP|nr:hypothetical protein FVE85_4298 [Porphyridium purpureum]|eukprot:POR6861..scf229_5